jgi:hypothetical protein
MGLGREAFALGGDSELNARVDEPGERGQPIFMKAVEQSFR